MVNGRELGSMGFEEERHTETVIEGLTDRCS